MRVSHPFRSTSNHASPNCNVRLYPVSGDLPLISNRSSNVVADAFVALESSTATVPKAVGVTTVAGSIGSADVATKASGTCEIVGEGVGLAMVEEEEEEEEAEALISCCLCAAIENPTTAITNEPESAIAAMVLVGIAAHEGRPRITEYRAVGIAMRPSPSSTPPKPDEAPKAHTNKTTGPIASHVQRFGRNFRFAFTVAGSETFIVTRR